MRWRRWVSMLGGFTMAAFAVVTPDGCRVSVPSQWFVQSTPTISSDCEFLCFDDFD